MHSARDPLYDPERQCGAAGTVEDTNELVGTDPSALDPAMHRLFAGEWKEGGIPPLWDGRLA